MPKRRISIGLALTVLLVAAHAQAPKPLLNRPSPAFSRVDLQHTHVSLAQYRGKVVLLNFWATWCAPCQLEMPQFIAWQKQYGGEGLQIVGISMDDDDAPVRSFVQKLAVNYPVVMGDAALGERYGGVLGLPVTFLIDRKGVIRARFEGETDLKRIEVQVRELLGGTAP